MSDQTAGRRAGASPMGLIGGDWGGSNLRLFRFGPAGEVLEQRQAARGVLDVGASGFEAALAELIGDWLEAPARVILSGMVGSRQGWVEAPYLACPAGAAEVAARLTPVASRLGEVSIVPGLSVRAADGRMDVMRGEETQIFGALGASGGPAGLVIAPGTHSKWARVEAGRITGFSTFMTGELFAVLAGHSILGRLMRGRAHDPAAFETGVVRALADPAITRLLFSVRTEGLFEQIAPEALAAYLSGLLIGAEAAAGLAGQAATAASVIAAPAIGGLYRTALGLAGLDAVTLVDGDAAAAAGLWRLAQGEGAGR
jgi:2-dehydro-3-deoxygalactonokinase